MLADLEESLGTFQVCSVIFCDVVWDLYTSSIWYWSKNHLCVKSKLFSFSRQSTKAVYDRIIDLRIATPQIIINYTMFLEEHNYFEESFKVIMCS